MEQLGGIIWDVTKYLCGCAKEQAVYVYDLEENLKSLEDKWEGLLSMKEDVKTTVEEAESTGEMQRTNEVNRWLNQVDALQEEIKDIQVQRAQEIQNKCLSKCCPKNCMSSYKLGKNVAKMLKNVHELATDGKRFGNDFKIAHKLPPRPIEIPVDETVGLDLMFDKVWNNIETENVDVLGLYGMGGVGKTTLLRKINNELGKRRSDFDVVMWVVVSKEPNLDSIMDSIRKWVGIGDDIWNCCSNRDEKAAKIYRVLKQKKFVLLMDDIWERMDLKMVGVPHPKDNNLQSKVLFTTRFEDVCAKMQAQRKFKVEILTEKEALELFHMKVGEETLKSHPNIPKLAQEMAAECKGLPLALIVVGSAMAGVKSLEAWERSKNNLTSSSWTALDLETKVFSILKFSYDQLPDEAHKSCFLYCALYPEDYEILVCDLIDKWIGEGFLCRDITKSVRDMRDDGESIIVKLKLSCLLESVEDDVFIHRTVKMHDVIRDMALWLACDQDKNKKKVLVQGDALAVSQDDVERWKIVERVSMRDVGESHIPSATCPNLITFLNSCKAINGLQNFQYMSRLKVLELRVPGRLILPVEIGGLVLLEYLLLKGEMVAFEFPIELKNLKNLKFFILLVIGGDLANILLEVISSLQQLRVLKFLTFDVLEKREEEREFLEELECLPNLEELWIKIKTRNGLNKLFGSAKLQSCVCGLFLEDMGTLIHMPSLIASMSEMKHLRQISFLELNNVEDSSVFDACRLTMLGHVSIYYCSSIIHLTWLKYAPLLQELTVDNCESMEEVIKEGTKDDKGRENMDCIFSSLVRLDLNDLPKLKSIHRTVLPFPSLRSIEIIRCQNLKKLPFDSNSAKNKLRHIIGNRVWWDNLEWDDPTAEDKFQSKCQFIDWG